MWSRTAAAAAFAVVAGWTGAFAADQEGCLLCHALPLRRHSAEAPLFAVPARAGGLHEALFCSDCHVDARVAPHLQSPGPASCLGECHGGTAADVAAHRRASFGGLAERHRKISMPRAPCSLCHGAADGKKDRAAVAARCGSCHPRQRESGLAGVHGRLPRAREPVLCTSCHAAHGAQEGGTAVASPSCGGQGCHTAVTESMRRLAGHGGGARGGPALGAGLLFAGIASAGWFLGRFLAAGGPGGRG